MYSEAFTLNDRRILVTGASSGIGQEIAITCSNMGAQLVITGRDQKRLKETLSMLSGHGHEYITADLTVKEERDSLIIKTGNINGLVHSAGVAKLIPIKFYSEKLIRWLSTINYEAPVLITNDLLRAKQISNNSSIVFISSISSLISIEGNGLYSGTKSALVGVARAMALELASNNIRVNCISPGLVETPLVVFNDSLTNEDIKKSIGQHPLGIVSPVDVANAVVFLLSKASRMITGTNIIVDGGYCAR